MNIYGRWILSGICMLLAACSSSESQKEDTAQSQSASDVALSKTSGLKLEKTKEALNYVKTNNMNTDFAILVDMSMQSGKKRLFVWDFKKNKVIASGLVAHGYGQGSTESQPVFSNVEGSFASSLGKYALGAKAPSKWGIKIHYKMHGLEKTNSNAFKRVIVLHSNEYVPNYEIHPMHLPLGFSQGCPVISNQLMSQLDKLLQHQQHRTLLWIYQ